MDKLYTKKLELNHKEKHKNDSVVATKIPEDDKIGCVLNWINKMMKEWEDKLFEIYSDP